VAQSVDVKEKALFNCCTTQRKGTVDVYYSVFTRIVMGIWRISRGNYRQRKARHD